MQEHIFRNGLHDGAVLWDFTQGGINLFLKVIHKFGSYILAVDKPTGVINIPERYIIDKFVRILTSIRSRALSSILRSLVSNS